MRSRFLALVLFVVAAMAAMHRLVVTFGRRWGAEARELTASLPGDDLVPDADSQATMDAPPEHVWPWLVQMGVDRAGFYSLLPVENGIFRLGVENADRIVPDWQDLQVGDTVAFMPDGYPGGRRGPRVTAIEPNRSLVLDLGGMTGETPGSWQFVLEPAAYQATRLLMRSRSSADRPVGLKLFDTVAEPGYLIMDIAMLLGIKERAERHQAA
jgi:hypothetical protein